MPPDDAGTTDALFRLLADPTRRRILDLLAARGDQSVGELAAQFPGLVASGISKHLMALRAAGLVHATKDGRRRCYRLDPDAFADALAPWLATYERYWSGALERLRVLAEAEAPGGEPAEPEQPAREPAKPAQVAAHLA